MVLKSILMGAGVLVGATLAVNAQSQYQAYPYRQMPVAPPSWNYDPYTSGLGLCPQRFPTDPPCSATISPSYGQPSYWSRTR
jgi:hypothetical protein